jgi:hypothetical protein
VNCKKRVDTYPNENHWEKYSQKTLRQVSNQKKSLPLQVLL